MEGGCHRRRSRPECCRLRAPSPRRLDFRISLPYIKGIVAAFYDGKT